MIQCLNWSKNTLRCKGPRLNALKDSQLPLAPLLFLTYYSRVLSPGVIISGSKVSNPGFRFYCILFCE